MKSAFIKAAVAAAILAALLCVPCAATSNPVQIVTTLYWRVNGVNYDESLLRGDYYNPGYSGWCGHYTRRQHKYCHTHITSTFNYWSQRYGMTVTLPMVDAYWDWYYAAYSKVGPLNQSYNCYGYATGYDTWINIDGAQLILDDEWEQTDGVDCEIQWLITSDHMRKTEILVEPMPEQVWIEATTEKNRDSGAYGRYIQFPPGISRLRGNGYAPLF